MQYTLENDRLVATIDTHGAELHSVRSKATGREYIWPADPAVWARHAPVLFPIVGKLKDDQYQVNGQTYSMSQHGFARDQEFEFVQQQNQTLTFRLTANNDTRAKYPFNFVLNIAYHLSDNQLQITYQVTNQNQEEMPFSIGAHPAFYCPAQIEGRWEEYHLLFAQAETLDRQFLEDGLRTGETKQLVDNSRQLPLHRSLFEHDALVFENVVSDSVSIIAQSTGEPVVTVHFAGFPYLGIWQKVGADFYCIEPWYGVADAADTSGKITEKEGIQMLAPDDSFKAVHRITFR